MNHVIVIALLALQGGEDLVTMRIYRASRLIDAGEIAAATDVLESVVASYPKDRAARLWLGWLAVNREEWHDAERHLQIAVRPSRTRARGSRALRDWRHREASAWFFLGVAREGLGDLDGASHALDEAIGYYPSSVLLRVQRAKLAIEQDDLWSALRHSRAASTPSYREGFREPNDEDILPEATTADAMAVLSDVASLMGSQELARCAANAAVDSAPEVGQNHFRLAAIYEQRGNLYRGISSAYRALELGFDTADVHASLGRLHFSATHWSQSISAFETAVALEPAAAATIPSFSLETLPPADYTALRHLLEGVDDRNFPNVLETLGAMSLRESDFERAGELFERLVALTPDNAQAQYNLAQAYFGQDRDEEGAFAMDRFRRLQEMEALASKERAREAHLWLDADALLNAGRFADAVSVGLQAIEAEPTDTEPLIARSELLLDLGRTDEARELIERALELSPYDTGVWSLATMLGDRSARQRLALLEPTCR